jgi:hypothetical protein
MVSNQWISGTCGCAAKGYECNLMICMAADTVVDITEDMAETMMGCTEGCLPEITLQPEYQHQQNFL